MALTFGEVLTDTHRLFFERLNLSFTCGDFLFVHAGVRPGIPLQKQSERDLLWIREDFLLHEEDFGKIVVHGHTPAIEPEIRSNRINIDTGAYATGRLTCLVLEGNETRFL
jgi:serine/threonine protein phosphatase 1